MTNSEENCKTNRHEMAVFGGIGSSAAISSQFHIVQFISMTFIIPKENLRTYEGYSTQKTNASTYPL